MNVVRRISLIAIAIVVMVSGLSAQEMTKDEWQKQMNELTAQRNELRSKLNTLQTDIDNLKKEDAAKAAALKKCNDDLLALVGATAESERAFAAMLDQIDGKINELSRLSNQDLWARKGELDGVQNMINEARKNKLSLLPKYYDRLKEQQNRVDALRRALESAGMQTYTVGTWARDRDCLWNIAKKPAVYDNAFLWPKIWQGNKDQIKNPDIIKPGQKLKIPPKGELTQEEKAAARSYWQRKQGTGSAQ